MLFINNRHYIYSKINQRSQLIWDFFRTNGFKNTYNKKISKRNKDGQEIILFFQSFKSSNLRTVFSNSSVLIILKLFYFSIVYYFEGFKKGNILRTRLTGIVRAPIPTLIIH